MMIDCNEAGKLMEQSEFEKLSWLKKRKLKFHLGMCKACKKYENDNHVLARVIRMASSKHSDTCLSDDEKIQMKEKLAKQ